MQKSKRLRIIIDDKIPFIDGVLDFCAEIKCLSGKHFTPKAIENADALLIRTRTQCNAELLDNSKLSFIGSATIGYDHIDTNYCDTQQITWTNAPGCNADSVAQYITAALLHLEETHHFDLKNKTLGIIGVGNVGKKVALAAQALGMKIILNDPPRQRKEDDDNFKNLDFLIEHSDIISLHIPLSHQGIDSTFHMVDAAFFNKFTQSRFFINSSRGEVVDEKELKKAINDGKVSAAVIDVWENEPNADTELLNMADIATPHIAGYSNDGKANGTAMIIHALSRHFDLGLENWYPENLPQDENQEIQIAAIETKEIINEAVKASYNILKEDQRFRMNPREFENIRGNYGLRREFPHYFIRLEHENEEAETILNLMGFRTVG
ncbi:MAG: 4-phosphoerythronate dehydrogenase [Bacteroidales bacterium]|nr:4-phosphoerythronate dehydrogenase [Bacteroidales bacterium]